VATEVARHVYDFADEKQAQGDSRPNGSKGAMGATSGH
jgi:hypothetical protein